MTTEEKLAMAKVWFANQAKANGLGVRHITEDGPGVRQYDFVAFCPEDVDPDKTATLRMVLSIAKPEIELNIPEKIIELMRVRWRSMQSSAWHRVIKEFKKGANGERQDTIQWGRNDN